MKKNLLLIDAVHWSERYPPGHPLRNVERWFKRHFQQKAEVELQCVRAEDAPIRAVREFARGVIISGSPRDAWAADPINDELSEVIVECRDRRIPFLGVCYGHQLLAQVLGAKVGRHRDGLQLETVKMELTAAGRDCSLFRRMPDRFPVLSSHADVVFECPPNCELLARGGQTEVQAIGFQEYLFGVQFHPEMDPEIVRFLWEPRLDDWKDLVSFDIGSRLAQLTPTPDASLILKNFVDSYIE